MSKGRRRASKFGTKGPAEEQRRLKRKESIYRILIGNAYLFTWDILSTKGFAEKVVNYERVIFPLSGKEFAVEVYSLGSARLYANGKRVIIEHCFNAPLVLSGIKGREDHARLRIRRFIATPFAGRFVTSNYVELEIHTDPISYKVTVGP